MTGDSMLLWTSLWLVTAATVLIRHWRKREGAGLMLTYILSFAALHWLAPAMYLLPWYDTRWRALTVLGMRESALAMVAFAVGAEVVAAVLRRKQAAMPEPELWSGEQAQEVVLQTKGPDGRFLRERPQQAGPEELGLIDERVASLYLAAGAVMYFVISPVSRHVPSLNALVSTGSMLAVGAIAIKCWNAWQKQARSRIRWWLAIACCAPIVTVVAQGYLGYGFAAMLTVFSFVASIYRPRWKVIAVGVMLGYLGLSVFVTYMRDRDDIRATVWGGQDLEARMNRLAATVSQGEWFDLQNIRHLDQIDLRLNQDYLIGASVAFLERGTVPFAGGSTLREAALAIVPRALWPEKPTAAGSGDLVSIYTGLHFDQNTSVGIGQVMECYVNFGTTGVVVGFFVIGGLIVLVDRSAIRALRRGDGRRFVLWYLPGLSLLQIGGSFVEVTGTAAAALVVALVLSRLSKRGRGHAHPVQEPATLTPVS